MILIVFSEVLISWTGPYACAGPKDTLFCGGFLLFIVWVVCVKTVLIPVVMFVWQKHGTSLLGMVQLQGTLKIVSEIYVLHCLVVLAWKRFLQASTAIKEQHLKMDLLYWDMGSTQATNLCDR